MCPGKFGSPLEGPSTSGVEQKRQRECVKSESESYLDKETELEMTCGNVLWVDFYEPTDGMRIEEFPTKVHQSLCETAGAAA